MSSGPTLQQSHDQNHGGHETSDFVGNDCRSRKALDECVICLQPISERAVAVPCNHLSFDFICLASWLQEHPQCPLCKTVLSAVQYDFRAPDDFKTYEIPSGSKPTTKSYDIRPLSFRARPRLNHTRNRDRFYRRARSEPCPANPDSAIQRRRFVYRERLYSLHVGSNRLSRFKDFTPQYFARSSELQARANKWIRRELQVFDFLNAEANPTAGTAGGRRKAENAEFLLLYIIAVLKTVDIKDSNGKAEELLRAYLGEDNCRLFLHELEAWLRSPYNSLEDWDRAVQYRIPLPRYVGSNDAANGTTTPHKPYSGNWQNQNAPVLEESPRNADLQRQRAQAQLRYVPD